MAELDLIATFDKKSISLSYDNGWGFTNTFDGHTRVIVTERRGELREPIYIRELRPGLFLISWVDGEIGQLAQIIDLENRAVLAAVERTTAPALRSSAPRFQASTAEHRFGSTIGPTVAEWSG